MRHCLLLLLLAVCGQWQGAGSADPRARQLAQMQTGGLPPPALGGGAGGGSELPPQLGGGVFTPPPLARAMLTDDMLDDNGITDALSFPSLGGAGYAATMLSSKDHFNASSVPYGVVEVPPPKPGELPDAPPEVDAQMNLQTQRPPGAALPAPPSKPYSPPRPKPYFSRDVPNGVARYHHCAVLLEGNKIVIMGGINRWWRRLNDLWEFDINENLWEPIEIRSGPRPQGRFTHSCISRYNTLTTFGGVNQWNHRLNDVWEFSMELKQWRYLRWWGSGPSPRGGHASAYANNRMIVMGGFGWGHLYNDLWQFRFANNRWEPIYPRWRRPYPRAGHTAVFDEHLYIYGGHDYWHIRNDLWRFEFDTRTWHHMRPSGPRPPSRCYHGMVSKGRIYVIGGHNRYTRRKQRNDVHMWDPGSNRWQPLRQDMHEMPGWHGHTVVLRGDTLFVHGGWTGYEMSIKTYEFDIVARKWSRTGFIPAAMQPPKIFDYYRADGDDGNDADNDQLALPRSGTRGRDGPNP